MKPSINERAFLSQAIRAFHQETGLDLHPTVESEVMPCSDGLILELGDTGIQYSVELKRWAQQANIGTIVAQLRRMPPPALLVADYVNPNMADRLREAGAQFIDAAGNAYLNEKTFFIFVKGNRKRPVHASARKTSRAFNSSGLKLIFSFLMDPHLVGETYRKMAEVSGVSLGAIGWVLNDLKDKGYVREHGKKGARSLENPMGPTRKNCYPSWTWGYFRQPLRCRGRKSGRSFWVGVGAGKLPSLGWATICRLPRGLFICPEKS